MVLKEFSMKDTRKRVAMKRTSITSLEDVDERRELRKKNSKRLQLIANHISYV